VNGCLFPAWEFGCKYQSEGGGYWRHRDAKELGLILFKSQYGRRLWFRSRRQMRTMKFLALSVRLLCASATALAAGVVASCSTRPTPSPAVQFTVKEIIAKTKPDQLFIKQVDARDLSVGHDRTFSTFEGRNRRGACFRASVASLLDANNRRTVTYVAIVDDNRVVDRRPAGPADRCELDSYEPVVRSQS
jgi:hypothetical protein